MMQDLRIYFIIVLNAFIGVLALSGDLSGYDRLDGLTDTLLREVMSRINEGQMDLSDSSAEYLDRSGKPEPPTDVFSKDSSRHPERYRMRKEGQQSILGGPSLRDPEYIQHSSLWGHQYMAGGAGEGFQRLKPDGSVKNIQVVKTDVLPAYCNPPNPCPLGYVADDGCLEDFENTAAFSRDYQASQDCMCDTEHMFDCPGSTQENEVDALARSIQNEGLMDSTLDRIAQHIDDSRIDSDHRVVAKKYFSKERHESYLREFQKRVKKSSHKARPVKENPYLVGEKLPVVAKKAPAKPLM